MVRRSRHSVGRGLARAFHSYLTNVIVGVEGVSLPHTAALHDYLAKQRLTSDEYTWIGDKVLILFPDSNVNPDSVADLLEREKKEGGYIGLVYQVVIVFRTYLCNLCIYLVFVIIQGGGRGVEHHYEIAGKMRQSVLHMIKLRHGGDNGWRNNYFIFAENRPLIALHQVALATVFQLCCNCIPDMCAAVKC